MIEFISDHFVAFLILGGTAIWFYLDAKTIGVTNDQGGPIGWAIACVLLWIIAFPAYLYKRSEFRKRFQSSSISTNPNPVPVSTSTHSQDFDQQLRRLAKLKDDGIISQDDFDRKKNQLLGM